MDPESSGSGKITERPITRWRRDQEDAPSVSSNKIDRPPTGIVRPQSKYERPRSRRGYKDEQSDHVGSATFRSATPGRLALARPPSASLAPNRAPTANSGLIRMGSGLSRAGTGLATTKQFSVSMLDRPITQHGIAGVRPGTTRGLPMRQIQDKRYYEGLLQLKIRELTQEIGKIMKDIEAQNKEKTTFLHYDKRAKSLATELTELQAELADYNLVMDKMTLDVDKEVIEQEAKELALMNERRTAEVERMFEQRKQMEQKLHKMEKDIENEKRRTEHIIESMDPPTKEKYDDLFRQKTELQEQAQEMQRELDELSKEQAQLEEQTTALSQLKQEAVKLQVRIIESEEKRDRLRDEERKRLSPEDEKEQLLQKIKRDNTDIAATEAQIIEKEKKVAELEQQLEQLETDMEDNQSDKQIKYQELRKREEMIEEFMSTYEQSKKEEMEKTEKLEREIVEKLGVISNAVENNEYLTEAEEMAILRDKFPYNDYEATHREDDFEKLKKDYTTMQQMFNRMRILEEKLQLETKQMKEKVKKQQSELIVLEDLDGLKTRNKLERDELVAEREKLTSEELTFENELKSLQAEHDELKEKLEKYSIYPEISRLEDKLEKLKENNKKIEKSINDEKDRVNYEPLKEKAFKLMKDYSVMIQENLQSVY